MNCSKMLAGIALTTLALVGCAPAKPELHVYTWSDYIDAEVIAQFEAANNCKVVVDTFDSNEAMFAKLLAGSTGYDIIMPSSYQIPAMIKKNLVQKMDKSKLPNVAKNFDKAYYNCILDKTMAYNVPYAVTYTGFAYRKDKVGKAPIDSWKVLETESMRGRMSLLSDMRETIGAALKMLGYSLNTTKKSEIDEAVKLVLKWKKNIAKFDNEQYKTAVASGEWFIGHGYSSDSIQIVLEDDNVGFALPKEGFSIACDEMVIASDAKQPDLAHAFINYLYEPEVSRKNMESVCAPMPCAPAIQALPEKMRKIICVDAATIARGEVLRDFDSQPEVRNLYIQAWDSIKAGE